MIIVFTLALIIKPSASDPRRDDLRVYQGEIDSKNQFPFAVTLEVAKEYRRFCTGSLVAQNWVLTANHCVHGKSPSEIVIRYGDHTRPANETNLYKKVIEIYKHPRFTQQMRPGSINDIALLLVEKVPKKEHVKLLAVDYKTLFGLPVTYAGFGLTSRQFFPKDPVEINKDRLMPLQVGEGVVVPCRTYKIRELKYSAVCIVPKCSKRRQQARPGDSGGPLLYDGRLIGVARSVQFSIPISQYTPVSPFLEWIRSTMQSKGN